MLDTSCPRGMYNDMSQRCVPDVIDPAPIATTVVASAPPAPPAQAAAAPPKDVGPMVRIAGFDKIPAFDLDVTEVTVRAYATCAAAGACIPHAAHDDPDLFGLALHASCNTIAESEHPVNCVSLAQARAYCAWAGKRLPRPEEWILAAGGPNARPFPWGAQRPVTGDLCAGGKGSCVVGSHPLDATPEGVKDMAGNLTEWTDDEFPGYSGGTVPMVFVLGGNWFDHDPRVWDVPSRSDTSFVANAEQHSALVGFRCARST